MDRAKGERILRLLREKPYPLAIGADELRDLGIAIPPALSVSVDVSAQELVRLYLSEIPTHQARNASRGGMISLLSVVALLRRLCASTAHGDVAGRFFVIGFQGLFKDLVAYAKQQPLSEDAGRCLAELEAYWVHFDCYPDLETEKRQEGSTGDEELRRAAGECETILDLLWADLTGRQL